MTERSGGQISDRTLDALRTTATIIAAVPNVAAQICDSEGVVVEVRRPPFPELDHPVIPVCVFHRAVVTATELRREGQHVAMQGLAPAQQPSIDWGFSGSGCVLAGDILRLTRGQQWWHLAAVPSDAALAGLAMGDQDTEVEVSLHADDDLGATVLYARTPAGDERGSAAAVDALLAATAAIGIADLEVRLGATMATVGRPGRTLGDGADVTPDLLVAGPKERRGGRSGPWVAGCARCGEIDVRSMWPLPEHVAPHAWRCARCLSPFWEPVPATLPELR